MLAPHRGIDGMRVGGTRRLEIAPHLAYGDAGLAGLVPPRTTLIAEITILEEAGSPGATADSAATGGR